MTVVEAENEELKGVLPRSYGKVENKVLVELLRLLNGLGEIEGDGEHATGEAAGSSSGSHEQDP